MTLDPVSRACVPARNLGPEQRLPGLSATIPSCKAAIEFFPSCDPVIWGRIKTALQKLYWHLRTGERADLLYRHEPLTTEHRCLLVFSREDGSAEELTQRILATVGLFASQGMDARLVDPVAASQLLKLSPHQHILSLQAEPTCEHHSVAAALRQTLQDTVYLYCLKFRRVAGCDPVNSGALGKYGLCLMLENTSAEVVMETQRNLFQLNGLVSSWLRAHSRQKGVSAAPAHLGDACLVAELIPF